MSRTKKVIEERRRVVAKYVEEGYCKQEHAPYLLPKQLWRNVPLDVYELGEIEVVFHGDDHLDEGFVKKIELRLKKPVMLSFIKKWMDEGGLLKALHWVLALNKVVEPPKDQGEGEASKWLAELKAMLDYIEEVRKRYLR